MNRNRIRIRLTVHAVELLLEHRLGNDAAESTHQHFEDGELMVPKRNSRRIHAHVAANGVEGEIAGLEGNAQCVAWPAQQRPDAGHQFDHGKRLDQVIVGPGIQTGDAVLYGIAGSQNEHGDGAPAAPHRGEQLEPVAVRQSQIENGGVVGDEG